MARHGCRPQTAILCWSWINLFCWRNTWRSVCLWSVSWWLIGGPKMIPNRSRVGEPTGEVPITEPNVCVSTLVTQSCPTLCNPTLDCSLPGSFIHGILQARILEWVAISFSKRLMKVCKIKMITILSSTVAIKHHWDHWVMISVITEPTVWLNSQNPGVWKYFFFLDLSEFTCSLCLKLSRVTQDLLKSFIFLVKALFCIWILFRHFGLIGDQIVSLKLASLQPIPSGTGGCFSETMPIFFSLWTISLEGLSSGNCHKIKKKKAFGLAPLGPSCLLKTGSDGCKLFKLSHLCSKLFKLFENCSLL